MGALMNDVGKPEQTEAIVDLGSSFAKAGSDATRRMCEQGQTIALTMGELNTEMSHFISQRVERAAEAIGRMTKCQSLPEMFTVQGQWFQDAADDYLREMTKLLEINGKIMGGLLGSMGRFEAQAPSAKVPMRVKG